MHVLYRPPVAALPNLDMEASPRLISSLRRWDLYNLRRLVLMAKFPLRPVSSNARTWPKERCMQLRMRPMGQAVARTTGKMALSPVIV